MKLLGIGGEDMLYEFACVTGCFTVCGKFVLVVTNVPDGWSISRYINAIRQLTCNSFDIFSLEGRAPDDESVQDGTHQPSVNFEAMPISSIKQHFQCNIVLGTTNGLLPLTRALNKGSEPKVTNLNIHAGIKEQVSQLEIPVDDLRVHVVARPNELYHEEACFRLGEAAATAKHVHE
jgi:hypothetical protein